ncbi:MAG TPA: shikimate kinase [Vicinamibacterales bacterium]|jgi:XRE family aerobic/anaerobic benzoate catabolism transcriptional regulator|nr:shikimate kinase [Vicinamibacterales bacterium]
MGTGILEYVGRRVRGERARRHWTIRELAERSGLSVRFLVQLEAGSGNISLKRLDDLARAFNLSAADLVAVDVPDAPRVVALLGLRGAGKTTIGRQLARCLRVRFVELDRRIEKAADMSLGELFSLYGEEYYRRLERETLKAVLAERRPMVLATGGGIVASPETYALLKKSAVTVWLRASPEDHWNRVVSQGDRRPMADHPQAMADLRALLAAREPLYASADHTIQTSNRTVDDIVDQLRGSVYVD